MRDWKNLFQRRILERGEEYFEDGMVSQVTQTSTGYQAIVEGTDAYEVEIEMDEDGIYDMFCTCPYAEDGNYCKHMAAVLYHIHSEDKAEELSWMEREQLANKELEDTIAQIPENELRNFVKCIAKENEEIKNLLLTTYSRKIDAQQISRLRQEVDAIVYRYGDRYGFIDYRNAWNFTSELEGFLYDKVHTLIDRSYYMQAFELTNYVFKLIGNIDMDDSDGGTTSVANACYEMWQGVLKHCSEGEKKKLFLWFQKHSTGGYVVDFMEDYLQDFLMNEFHDKELLLKKLEMIDLDIARQEKSTDCGSTWSAHYGYQNNILKRLELMKELEYSEEEMKQYRKKNWKFSAVRALEIQELLEENNVKQAIAVLKESKELDKEYSGLVSNYSKQLIQIYEQEMMQAEYKEELLFYVFLFTDTDIKYILKLKDICNEQEWLQNRERLLQRMKGTSNGYRLMESEGLFKEMLQSISLEVKKNSWIARLDEYEKLLKPMFPEEIRDIYASYVRQAATRVADRKRYQELVSYLKKVKKYPDGKEIAMKIARDWRSLYYRRSAMMDEMRKAGF